ncbi:MAG: hypothetical protein QOK05_872 [Chloroflexota bacterium]|nr:hypothetical protein [Chloroflexota bacterium]
MKTASAFLLLGVALGLGGCGQALDLTHTETACITPGQKVTLQTTTMPGTTLTYKVQDDFGGDVGTVGPVIVGNDGKASVSWQSPTQLSTTTLHFLVTAANGDKRANRDIHVVVGGNGRSC